MPDVGGVHISRAVGNFSERVSNVKGKKAAPKKTAPKAVPKAAPKAPRWQGTPMGMTPREQFEAKKRHEAKKEKTYHADRPKVYKMRGEK